MENPAQLRDWLRETILLDTTELSKKHPGIFIAGSDVVEQTLREYEMQMMLTLELSLPCGHWKKNSTLKIKDPVQKSTKKRLRRLIGRMSLIMNTSKEQSKSVANYLESELVRMYANTLPHTLLSLYRVLEIEDHDVPDVLHKCIEEKKMLKKSRATKKTYPKKSTSAATTKLKKIIETKTTSNTEPVTTMKKTKQQKPRKKKAQIYQSIAATETIARGLAEKKKLVHSHYSHGMSNMNKLLTNVKIGNATKLLKRKIRKKRKASSSLVSLKKTRSRSVPSSTKKKHIVEETPIKSRFVADTPVKSRVVLSTPTKSKCVAETPIKKTSSNLPSQKFESPTVVRIKSRMISETPDPKRRRRRK